MGIILNFDFVLPIIIYLKINDFLIEQIYKGIKKEQIFSYLLFLFILFLLVNLFL